MKPVAMIATLSLALVVAAACAQSTLQDPPASSAPPELVPSPAPAGVAEAGGLPEGNGLCLVCHLDFEEESFALEHLQAGISCTQCHGSSVDHMHDETMMTSPDLLFGRTEVDAMCSRCHEQGHQDLAAVESFRREWTGRRRENGRRIGEHSVCTDCHGEHTIPRR